jgi:hypothetical protein
MPLFTLWAEKINVMPPSEVTKGKSISAKVLSMPSSGSG